MPTCLEHRPRISTLAPTAIPPHEQRIIRGYVVAEAGNFKSGGRGCFDSESLNLIVRLMRQQEPLGVKSRFTHPPYPLSGADALGSFLGRAHNARRQGSAVLADLHLDESAFVSPKGDLGTYLLTIARTDPKSFGTSLVLEADHVKNPKRGEPEIWRPTRILASDVVEDGDAVHSGFLLAYENRMTEEQALSDYILKNELRDMQDRDYSTFQKPVRSMTDDELLRWIDSL